MMFVIVSYHKTWKYLNCAEYMWHNLDRQFMKKLFDLSMYLWGIIMYE